MAKITTLTSLAGVKEAKELPHEFLLRIMAGEKFTETFIDQYGQEQTRDFYPSVQMRMEAAKLAAPYLAPRLASTTVDMNASLTVIGLADRLNAATQRLKTVS